MKKIFSLIFSFCYLVFGFEFCFASDNIIISQIQVSGISATDEFIELYNPTNRDIDLFDYKLQKKSGSGAAYNIVASMPEKSIIKAFSYYLIAHQNFSLQQYIKPDFIYSNYSLANDNSIILYDSDSNIIDVVGFGNCSYFEGSCLDNISSGQSFIRVNDFNNYGVGYGYGYGGNEILCGDFDINDNKKDFFIMQKSSARNSLFKNECKYVPTLTPKINNNNNLSVSVDKNINNKVDDVIKQQNTFNNIFTQNNTKGYINNNPSEDDLNNDTENSSEGAIKTNTNNIVLNNNNSKKDIVSKKYNLIDIDDLQSVNIGENISLYGVVSSISGEISNKYFYLNGAQIYNTSGAFPKLSVGDKVFVSGVVSSNYDEKRIKIKTLDNINIISKNNKIDIYDLYDSDDEINNFIAKLVVVNGSISRKSSNKIYVLKDNIETEIYLTDKLKTLYKTFKIGDNINVVGILNRRNDSYRIVPRNSNDISIVDDKIVDEENIQAASLAYDEDNNIKVDEPYNVDENINSKEKKLNLDNNSDNYVVKNSGKNLKILNYFIGVFVLIILFLSFIFIYKFGFWLKIKMFFKLKFNKIAKLKTRI